MFFSVICGEYHNDENAEQDDLMSVMQILYIFEKRFYYLKFPITHFVLHKSNEEIWISQRCGQIGQKYNV